MKRVYWRPSKVSKSALVLIGVLAVGGSLAVERLPLGPKRAADPQQKLAAAQLAARGMNVIRDERLRRGLEIDDRFDPAGSGLIGAAMTPITSLPAEMESKQTSINPNFAAAVVEMLTEAGVEPGDQVAVGYTGSLPALNLCVCAALETMQIRPLVIHSVASSQFGANDPELVWLDMEAALHDAGLISFHSHAATRGAFGDRARGMGDESKQLLDAAITRNGVRSLEIESLDQSIDTRMQVYDELAGGRPIKAYINVGGGAASIRGAQGKDLLGAGLTLEAPEGFEDVDCVAIRFAAAGTPVIHLGDTVTLARRFGLPVAPQCMPEVGTGAVFTARQPSRLLAALVLLAVLAAVRVSVWSDFWPRVNHRLAVWRRRREEGATPTGEPATVAAELMV